MVRVNSERRAGERHRVKPMCRSTSGDSWTFGIENFRLSASQSRRRGRPRPAVKTLEARADSAASFLVMSRITTWRQRRA